MSLYHDPWQKGFVRSLCGYLRDLFIFCLPFRRLPRILRIALLGVDPSFVFLVHPRRKDDIYIAWPFARPFRALLRHRFYTWLRWLPPTVLEVVKTPSGVNGVVVSSTWLPEALIHNRKAALREARRCVRFSSKLSRGSAYLGLGEWWPFLTKRAEAIQDYAAKRGIQVTSGYCGTLCSLQLSVKEMARIGGIDLARMKILILGVGKMGASVARALVNEVGEIAIFDKNQSKQQRVARDLSAASGQTTIVELEGADQIASVLATHDVCVCTTSNLRRILASEDLPENTIVLDDSRPEAVQRVYDKKRGILVLEGGLMKIRGVELRYDFGFGSHEDVFGCLAEAYMLARDGGKTLAPTVGEVDFYNFRVMVAAQGRLGIAAGGFRSGSIPVDPHDIAMIIRRKHQQKLLARESELEKL